MLGDQIGYGMSENLIRLKNGGQTPLEQKIADNESKHTKSTTR